MDDKYGMIKKIHYLELDKKMDKAMDSRIAFIKISKVLIKDEEKLKSCENLLLATMIKHERMIRQSFKYVYS